MTQPLFYKDLISMIKLDLRILKDDLRYIKDKRKRGDRVKEFLERLEDKLNSNGVLEKEKRTTS